MVYVLGTFITRTNHNLFIVVQVSLGNTFYLLAHRCREIAEKSRVLRSSGIPSRMASMLSEKPMFSISSASSSTTLYTLSN